MTTQELINYIKAEIALGKSKQQIHDVLLTGGWSAVDLDEAFTIVNNEMLVSVPVAGAVPMAPNQNIQLLGVFALLGQTWKIFKSRFWVLMGITFMGILAQGVILIILVLAGSNILDQESQNKMPPLLSFLVNIFFIIIQLWSLSALMIAIKDYKERTGVFSAYKKGLSKVWSIFIVSVLFGLILAGGISLFIIPGFIFLVYFMFSMYVVVAEDLKGMNALLKSREYTRGYWWPVFGRILFMLLILFILITLVSAMFVFGASLVKNGQLPFAALGLIVTASVVLVGFLLLIIGPFLQVYLFSVYENLKTIKGDFVFTPSKKSKRKFIFIGILGFLLPMFLAVVLSSLNVARQKAEMAKMGDENVVGDPSSSVQYQDTWMQ